MDWIGGNRYLNMDEMKNNATLLWNYFNSVGWTVNAVAGMLGNMQTESTVNPNIWENLTINYKYSGYGLVQWTPPTKYINWAGGNYESGWLQCERIVYELNNHLQYIPTDIYPMTFSEFSHSTESPYTLGMIFLANYERPQNVNQPSRGTQAEFWYEYLSGVTPEPPDPTPPLPDFNFKKMPLWLYCKKQ